MSSVTLGAMNGLLESIDPYASYLNAQQYKDYLKDYDSFRGDLGMVLAKKFGYITIVSVIPGSPAAKAGLTPRATCWSRSKELPRATCRSPMPTFC